MEFVDVAPDDERLGELLPVLRELRPHLDPASFRHIYRNGHSQGLSFTALYDGDTCVAVAGWRVIDNTSAVRKLYVDDLVTVPEGRSKGYGRALFAELERRARVAGCRVLDLDCGVQRHDAHRFYLRERMDIASYHFVKRLE